MSKLKTMSDKGLLILYRALAEELGQQHEAAKKLQAEIQRRGLTLPKIGK